MTERPKLEELNLYVPKFRDPGNADSPPPYRQLYDEWKTLDDDDAYRQAVEKVVASAGRTMVLFSGGSRIGDRDLLQKARICVASGATGLIFGRNMWQRPFEEGLEITQAVQEILKTDLAVLRRKVRGEGPVRS